MDDSLCYRIYSIAKYIRFLKQSTSRARGVVSAALLQIIGLSIEKMLDVPALDFMRQGLKQRGFKHANALSV